MSGAPEAHTADGRYDPRFMALGTTDALYIHPRNWDKLCFGPMDVGLDREQGVDSRKV